MKVAAHRAALLGAVIVVLSSLSGAAAYAAEEDGSRPVDNVPDRIIYLNEPAPQPAQDQRIISEESGISHEMRVVRGDQFPVMPRPGETVRIVYTDAVTDISTDAVTDISPRASCTKSMTTNEPTSANFVVVRATGVVSSGCGGGSGAKIALYSLSLLSSNTFNVPLGGTASSGTSKACQSGTNTSYYGIASWSNGGAVWGPSKTLPCRT